MLTSRGLGRVLGDLASMGFDARWGVLGAADVGAPHQRDRIWIVAKWPGHLPHAQHDRIGRWEQQQESLKEKARAMAHAMSTGQRGNKWEGQNEDYVEGEMAHASMSGLSPCNQQASRPEQPTLEKQSWGSCNEFRANPQWPSEPNVGRVVLDGMASRVDQLKAIGNGQVARVAATAWRILNND